MSIEETPKPTYRVVGNERDTLEVFPSNTAERLRTREVYDKSPYSRSTTLKHLHRLDERDYVARYDTDEGYEWCLTEKGLRERGEVETFIRSRSKAGGILHRADDDGSSYCGQVDASNAKEVTSEEYRGAWRETCDICDFVAAHGRRPAPYEYPLDEKGST
jgi:hypothetical protein